MKKAIDVTPDMIAAKVPADCANIATKYPIGQCQLKGSLSNSNYMNLRHFFLFV